LLKRSGAGRDDDGAQLAKALAVVEIEAVAVTNS
jgi:hypothetical protein